MKLSGLVLGLSVVGLSASVCVSACSTEEVSNGTSGASDASAEADGPKLGPCGQAMGPEFPQCVLGKAGASCGEARSADCDTATSKWVCPMGAIEISKCGPCPANGITLFPGDPCPPEDGGSEEDSGTEEDAGSAADAASDALAE